MDDLTSSNLAGQPLQSVPAQTFQATPQPVQTGAALPYVRQPRPNVNMAAVYASQAQQQQPQQQQQQQMPQANQQPFYAQPAQPFPQTSSQPAPNMSFTSPPPNQASNSVQQLQFPSVPTQSPWSSQQMQPSQPQYNTMPQPPQVGIYRIMMLPTDVYD